MPTGVEELSAAAGIISCSITLLHGCLKGLALLHDARSYGRSVSTIKAMIELEQHKLSVWASEAGLFDDPPVLHVKLQDADQIPKLLEPLETLLTDVDAMKESYGLNLEATDEELNEVEVSRATPKILHVWRRQQFNSDTAAVLHRRRKIWSRLWWVSVDECRVRKLFEDVRYFVNALEGFLEKAQQTSMNNKMDLLLRTWIINSADQQYLSMLGQANLPFALNSVVTATARLKRKGLMLNVLEDTVGDDEKSITAKHQPIQPPASGTTFLPLLPLMQPLRLTMCLSMEDLRISRLTSFVIRQIGHYDGRTVLLEWKTSDRMSHDSIETRVDKVCAFLHEIDDRSFHSLPCLGYLKDKMIGRYGFVFEVPVMATRLEGAERSTMRSLKDLLETKQVCPSLNLRVEHAITLVETALQLHTAGWMHKAICSENALFFLPDGGGENGKEAAFLNSSLYLAGYAYARADDPYEQTEPLASQVESELYRHPLYFGSSRAGYRKSFDIFSLGCILLELGVWTSLSTIFHQASAAEASQTDDVSVSDYSTPSSTTTSSRGSRSSLGRFSSEYSDRISWQMKHFSLMQTKHLFISGLQTTTPRSFVCNYILEQLEARAGKAYAKVVVDCLRAGSICASSATGVSVDEHQYALELERSSLLRLQLMAENI